MDKKLDMRQEWQVHSLEGQCYPGLHQKQCDQQDEGEDSPQLFHSLETPTWSIVSRFGVLSTGNLWTCLIRGLEADRVETVQLGEEKGSERLYCSPSVLERGLRDRWR